MDNGHRSLSGDRGGPSDRGEGRGHVVEPEQRAAPVRGTVACGRSEEPWNRSGGGGEQRTGAAAVVGKWIRVIDPKTYPVLYIGAGKNDRTTRAYGRPMSNKGPDDRTCTDDRPLGQEKEV